MRDPEFINFEPKTDYSRREFVVTTLATGFAPAVLPVAAQTASPPTPPASSPAK